MPRKICNKPKAKPKPKHPRKKRAPAKKGEGRGNVKQHVNIHVSSSGSGGGGTGGFPQTVQQNPQFLPQFVPINHIQPIQVPVREPVREPVLANVIKQERQPLPSKLNHWTNTRSPSKLTSYPTDNSETDEGFAGSFQRRNSQHSTTLPSPRTPHPYSMPSFFPEKKPEAEAGAGTLYADAISARGYPTAAAARGGGYAADAEEQSDGRSAGSASHKSIPKRGQRGRPPVARTEQELEQIKQKKLAVARAKRAAMTAEEKKAANERRRKN